MFLPVLFLRSCHACVMIRQLSERHQIAMFRSFICNGARQDLAACGTTQGIAPL